MSERERALYRLNGEKSDLGAELAEAEKLLH